jgi:hypothetical protein
MTIDIAGRMGLRETLDHAREKRDHGAKIKAPVSDSRAAAVSLAAG